MTATYVKIEGCVHLGAGSFICARSNRILERVSAKPVARRAKPVARKKKPHPTPRGGL